MLRVGSAHRICSHILHSWIQKLKVLRAKVSRAHLVAEASWCRERLRNLSSSPPPPPSRSLRRASRKKGKMALTISDVLAISRQKSNSRLREKISPLFCKDQGNLASPSDFDSRRYGDVFDADPDCSSSGGIRFGNSSLSRDDASVSWTSDDGDGDGDDEYEPVSLSEKHHCSSSSCRAIIDSNTDTCFSLSIGSPLSSIVSDSCTIESWMWGRSRPAAGICRDGRLVSEKCLDSSVSADADDSTLSGCSVSSSLRHDPDTVDSWTWSAMEPEFKDRRGRRSIKPEPVLDIECCLAAHKCLAIADKSPGVDSDAHLCCDGKHAVRSGGHVASVLSSEFSPECMADDESNRMNDAAHFDVGDKANRMNDSLHVESYDAVHRMRRHAQKMMQTEREDDVVKAKVCRHDQHMEEEGENKGKLNMEFHVVGDGHMHGGDETVTSSNKADDQDDAGETSKRNMGDMLERKEEIQQRMKKQQRNVWSISANWSSSATGGAFTQTVPQQHNVLAFVKMSEKPDEDFRQSIREMMIVEDSIHGVGDVQELLYCYLALNSPQHHALIEEAFVDVFSDMLAACRHPSPGPGPLMLE